MGAVTTLRKAVDIVLAEAEARLGNVLETINGAVNEFVGEVFHAAGRAVQQVVDTAFDLAGIVVAEAFNIADSVATAALGDVLDDGSLGDEDDDTKKEAK